MFMVDYTLDELLLLLLLDAGGNVRSKQLHWAAIRKRFETHNILGFKFDVPLGHA